MRDRQLIRSLFPDKRFLGIYVNCELDACKRRDANGFYRKTMTGEISDFTEASSPYDELLTKEFIVEMDLQNVDRMTDSLIHQLEQAGILLELEERWP